MNKELKPDSDIAFEEKKRYLAWLYKYQHKQEVDFDNYITMGSFFFLLLLFIKSTGCIMFYVSALCFSITIIVSLFAFILGINNFIERYKSVNDETEMPKKHWLVELLCDNNYLRIFCFTSFSLGLLSFLFVI